MDETDHSEPGARSANIDFDSHCKLLCQANVRFPYSSLFPLVPQRHFRFQRVEIFDRLSRLRSKCRCSAGHPFDQDHRKRLLMRQLARIESPITLLTCNSKLASPYLHALANKHGYNPAILGWFPSLVAAILRPPYQSTRPLFSLRWFQAPEPPQPTHSIR
jgi:hypothetical protein